MQCSKHTLTGILKPILLQLYEEMITVNSEIHTKHRGTLCQQKLICLRFNRLLHTVTTVH
jgi:hypothetical protein